MKGKSIDYNIRHLSDIVNHLTLVYVIKMQKSTIKTVLLDANLKYKSFYKKLYTSKLFELVCSQYM